MTSPSSKWMKEELHRLGEPASDVLSRGTTLIRCQTQLDTDIEIWYLV